MYMQCTLSRHFLVLSAPHVMQLFHAFVAHGGSQRLVSRDTFSNRFLLGAVAVSLLLLVVACYIPGLNTLLQQFPLTAFDWLCVGICVVLHLLIAELFRLVIRRFEA